MKEILISGYYGFRNSGDDALLQSIINDLEAHGLKQNITVLSANPGETAASYGVRAVNRMNIFAVAAHMRNAVLLISGGGTLLQDGTSTKSLLYYIEIIKTAQRFGVKTMLYSNGIGPLLRPMNRRITAKTLEKVDFITLRDAASERLLREIGVKHDRVRLTADPVFSLEGSPESEGRRLLADIDVPEGRRLLGISVRNWGTLKPDFFENVARAAEYAARRYDMYPVIIPMQSGVDGDASRKTAQLIKTQSSILCEDIKTEDMLSVISCMDLCIGMRLHTLIYAAAQGVPIIGLVYDPKVSGFMDYAHQTLYTEVESVSADGLMRLIDSCMSDYDAVKAELTALKERMKKLSGLNCMYAAELIEKGSVSLEQ